MPGLIEFVEVLKQSRVSGLQSQLLACLRVDTIVQRDLQDLRCVQITRQQIGLLAECTYLDTAGAASLWASSRVLPSRTSSLTYVSGLKTEG